MKDKIIVPEEYNYIGVFLTFDCPRACSYCLNRLSGIMQPRGILNREQWISGLNRLEVSIPLTFNGGEPTSHPDFFKIINSLHDETKVDLLTTLPYDADEFIRSTSPTRFKRNLPYAAIRVTYHPETMNLEETVRKAREIKDAGFDIALSLIDHPSRREKTEALRQRVLAEDIEFFIKPFLGYLDGTLHGQYRYAGACSNKFRKTVQCKTSNLLIDPQGDVYRCHADLFDQNEDGKIGNISDDIELSPRFTACTNFGFCNPCDVQIKFDRYGNWGYTVVTIVGGAVSQNEHSTVDWRYNKRAESRGACHE